MHARPWPHFHIYWGSFISSREEAILARVNIFVWPLPFFWGTYRMILFGCGRMLCHAVCWKQSHFSIDDLFWWRKMTHWSACGSDAILFVEELKMSTPSAELTNGVVGPHRTAPSPPGSTTPSQFYQLKVEGKCAQFCSTPNSVSDPLLWKVLRLLRGTNHSTVIMLVEGFARCFVVF